LTVERTIKRFKEIGSVKKLYNFRKATVGNTIDEKALDVAQSFIEDQRLSICKVAQ